METKARECIGYEIAPRLGFGRRFIISEMVYTSAGMEIIGAVDKVYFIEKSAYEKLQKRVQELEEALNLSGNACGIAATFLEFHGKPGRELNNCIELMNNHEKKAMEILGEGKE